MLDNISVFHSSIRIAGEKVIYFDPYKIDNDYHDASVIFITHEHYDHFSVEDIARVIKEDSIIVAPLSMQSKLDNYSKKGIKVLFVEPNEEVSIEELNLSFKAIPSYNIGKRFHPKENNWVGYVVIINDVTYYVAGDTDITDEARQVKCDVALIPCGGTYTMDTKEAATLTNCIHPKYAIPTHYGSVVGTMQDGNIYASLLDRDITCVIKIV